MPEQKEFSYSNYHEFDAAIDRICKEKGIESSSISRSPYGTYIDDCIVKLKYKNPESVADLKKIVDELLKKEGKTPLGYSNVCKFFYRDYCLMNVKSFPCGYLYNFTCGCDNPGICTPYKTLWYNLRLDDF